MNWEAWDGDEAEHSPGRWIRTDCRSPDGVTVGLVDSLITTCRVLRGRDFAPPAVLEALKDLHEDEDLRAVLSAAACAASNENPVQEIESLHRERDALRSALDRLHGCCQAPPDDRPSPSVWIDAYEAARVALGYPAKPDSTPEG